MPDTRSKEDILAGVLRIPVGGVEKVVPTLKLRAVRDWQTLLADKLGEIKPAMALDPTAGSIANLAVLTLDGILELVVRYDVTGALGGREWLEENADPSQLYAAVRQMGQVTFPFVDDLVTLVTAFPTLFVDQGKPSASTSSTNGHSRTGGSTRSRSKSASTRRS